METDEVNPAFRHRIVSCRPLLIAGIVQHCRTRQDVDVLSLWCRLIPHLGSMTCVEPNSHFGISYNRSETGGFEYLAGVEVEATSILPKDFKFIHFSASRYAVFVNHTHIAKLERLTRAIKYDWLPFIGYTMTAAPCFERFDAEFDKSNGEGRFEIWIPITTCSS